MNGNKIFSGEIRKKFFVCGGVLFLSILISANVFILNEKVATAELSDQVSEHLRKRILPPGVTPEIFSRSESVRNSSDLLKFYRYRAFRLAWTADDRVLPRARFLIKVIQESGLQGLMPDDYHRASLESLLAEMRLRRARSVPIEPAQLVDFDLLLTDALISYASHLLSGRINPEAIYSDWLVRIREVDLVQVLVDGLDSRQLEDALGSLLSPHREYLRLMRALMSYRRIAEMGGWPLVPEGPELHKGSRDIRVSVLRNRLITSHDLASYHPSEVDLFDDSVRQAVQRFQRRHGLEPDGIVGTATLAALNVPVEDRVRQIELNMERWHWGPHDFGRRYIVVNSANYQLKVVEDGRTVMTMRTVIGKPSRPTPVSSGKITHLVLNPYWRVPLSIATEDILPMVQEDPDYLSKRNIKVFRIGGNGAVEVKPTMVDWSRLSEDYFPYQLRQEPGPFNALGNIKFIFPNRFSVYLHDTPARGLFQKTQRGFSSGCIRIEDPIDLAEYLMRGDKTWTRAHILAAINGRVNRVVRLPEPIDVHLVYWTTWLDDEGTIHFRDDIYGRDTALARVLEANPPTPARSLAARAASQQTDHSTL